MKKIRVSDIAKAAGVSNATVSRALNQKELVNKETYQKIVDAMASLGCSQSSNGDISRDGKGNLLIIDLPSINNPFYSEIVRGVESAAGRYDYQLVISTTGLTSLMELIHSVRAVGVITLNSYTAAQLERLHSITEVVQCCEFCSDSDLPYISIDDYQASYQALRYLYTLGKRKIAFINGPVCYKYARERRRAYEDFLTEYNLPRVADWEIHLEEINYEMALAAVTHMLSREDKPDAVFASSDVLAAAAVKAACQQHIAVPQELSVIGFDNIDISSMSNPSITTVSQPRFQLGYLAGEMLIERIHNPACAAKQQFLDTELILRESTGF